MSIKNGVLAFIISLLLLNMLSCTEDNTTLLDKERFINITAELMIIEKLNLDKSEKTLLIQDVFNRYKVSADQYRLTKDHYKDDPAFWADVYKQVQVRIKDQINKKKSTQKKPK